jgi:hypothetical protein
MPNEKDYVWSANEERLKGFEFRCGLALQIIHKYETPVDGAYRTPEVFLPAKTFDLVVTEIQALRGLDVLVNASAKPSFVYCGCEFTRLDY